MTLGRGVASVNRTLCTALLCATLSGVASAAGGSAATLALTTASARAAIDRTHAVAARTVSMPDQAKTDPRVIWFPLFFVFDADDCLVGVYELDNLSQLSTTCAPDHPTFGDVFGRDAKSPRHGNAGLVVIATPASLAAMCEPCGRARTAIEDELRRTGSQAQVAMADFQVD